MADGSDYLEVQVGNHLLRSGTFTKPTSVWLGILKAVPTDDGVALEEISEPSYSRVQCGPDDANWAEPTDGSGDFVSITDYTFPQPETDWATEAEPAIAFGIWDAETGGNYIIGSSLLVAQEILASGLPPRFSAGDLIINFD